VVAVADGLPRNLLISHDDYEDRFDPHVWMNPNLWTRVVLEIRDALTDVHPDGAEVFRANADAYLDELAALAQYTQQVLSTVPAESRVLLSAHDAFNYFGSAYGFEVTGIQGISTESEAGLQRIAELVDMLVDRDIRAVFVESSVSDRNIRALIEGAAARGHDVVIGGELVLRRNGAEGHLRGHLCRHDRPQRDGHRGRARRRRTGSWDGGVAELMEPTIDDLGHHCRPDRVRCPGARRTATPRFRCVA
jgi:manganese/zinc/iron transport system substrate-binding protein